MMCVLSLDVVTPRLFYMTYSSSCVTIIEVMRCFDMSLMILRTSWTFSGARALVGSSKRMTSGFKEGAAIL